MKKLFLSAAFLSLVASQAYAADLPLIKSAPVSTPALIWTGAYVGLNADGNWENINSTAVSIWPTKDLSGYWTTASLLAGGIPTRGASGFIGGGQAGYNWQRSLSGIGLVLGLETDIQGIAGSSGHGNRPMTNLILTFSGHNQFSTYSSSSADSSLSYVGTARARIGFLIKPEVMIYGSGGFAYGQGSLSLSQFQQFGAAVGWSYSNTPSTLVGWSVGGGAEWMFLPNWSAKAEYIYYDLGNISTQNQFIAYGGLGAQWTYGSYATQQIDGNIIRAGVNYHLSFGLDPVVAK